MSEFNVFAYYQRDSINRDPEAEAIFERHKGRSIGKGTYIPTNERDIQYRFTSEPMAHACKRDLIKAGFRAVMKMV